MLREALNRTVEKTDTPDMGLFPDDFPFGSSRTTAAEPVSSVVPAASDAVFEYATVESSTVAATESTVAPAAAVLPIQPAPVAPIAPVAPATERRKALRQALVTRGQLRADVGFTGTTSVEVVNISLLGVRLVSPHPIDPQQKAQVRLETGPLRWSSRLRVVTCQPDGGGRYALGCQFVGNEMMKPWGAAAA